MNVIFQGARCHLERQATRARGPIRRCWEDGAPVMHATIALTMAFLNEAAPPGGVSWRMFVKDALIKAGLN